MNHCDPNQINCINDQKIIRRLWQSVFAKQVGTTVLAQGTILILALATAAITARWLGPTGKGQLALVMMVPAMFQLFLNAGLGPANVYYVGSGRLPVSQLMENAVAFSILGTAIGLLLMLTIIICGLRPVILPGVSSGYLMLGMIALPLFLLNGNMTSILQGLRRILTMNILSVAGALLTVILMAIVIIVLDFGILGALVATLSVQATMLLAIGWRVKQEGAHFRPKWNAQIVKPTLGYGMKSYMGNLLQFFNYRLDVFIVNFFLGPASVGIYGVAVALAELLWQIPNAASFVIFPKSANSTPEDMNRFTPRVFWNILAITIIGAIVLALFGNLVIRIVFSSAFLDAYIPLLVLLPGVVLLGAGKVLTHDMAGRGYPQYNSITAGVSLVVTVILDFALIPKMGVAGAAIASTISYALSFFVTLGFYFSVYRMKNGDSRT
ncbi:MAG: polysaccharide biosynthesis C-terminal domain-containing protein [Smithella sp.]